MSQSLAGSILQTFFKDIFEHSKGSMLHCNSPGFLTEYLPCLTPGVSLYKTPKIFVHGPGFVQAGLSASNQRRKPSVTAESLHTSQNSCYQSTNPSNNAETLLSSQKPLKELPTYLHATPNQPYYPCESTHALVGEVMGLATRTVSNMHVSSLNQTRPQ